MRRVLFLLVPALLACSGLFTPTDAATTCPSSDGSAAAPDAQADPAADCPDAR